jgi:hypothetical protein
VDFHVNLIYSTNIEYSDITSDLEHYVIARYGAETRDDHWLLSEANALNFAV